MAQDVRVLREYPQTEMSSSVGRAQKRKPQSGFFTAWKPRRKTVVDGAPKKPKE